MQLKEKIDLSVVMPIYRQEKQVIQYLHTLDDILAKLNLNYEIICVVDGFVDQSFLKAKTYKGPRVKVLGYPQNEGKGFAVRFGMGQAKGGIIGFVDGGHDIKYYSIPLALEHMKWYNADIIIGSKRHPASKVVYPWQRRILSWGYQLGTWILFGINVRDTQVGMKFFKKNVLKDVLPRLLVKTFAFDVEMLAVANQLGHKKIYEFPIELKMEFGTTSTIASMGFFRTAWNMLWDTLAVFYRLKIMHYYDNSNRKHWRQ